MCGLAALAALGTGAATAGTATAAGAATAGATIGSVMQGIGTAALVGGSLVQGVQGYQAGRAQAAQLEAQRRTEAQLTTQQDARSRARFAAALRRQTAELAKRGISLDSPTALLLAQQGGQEMAFESQAIRSQGGARMAELSASAQMARARGVSSLLTGTFSAAGGLLNAAPDLWPEIASRRIG